MPLSTQDRRELDFTPRWARLKLLEAISEIAPRERKLRRQDWVLLPFAVLAVLGPLFVFGRFGLDGGLGLFWVGAAALNALTARIQFLRILSRRAAWDHCREIGEYLLSLPALPGDDHRDE